MYLIVFIGLAWLLTAPVMAVLIGRVIGTADRDARPTTSFASLEADLRRAARQPAAGRS